MLNNIHQILFAVISIFLLASNFRTQGNDDLKVHLSRDFGYSSGTGQIEGRFSIKASGPADLSKVTFLIDDQLMAEVTTSPFKYQFSTSNYPLGTHVLSAKGVTSTGENLQSNEIKVEFVPAGEGMQAAGKIIGIVFGFLFLAAIVSIGITMLTNRKMKALPAGAPRSYGVFGGTVCPKCHRPFGIHILGLNLLVGKLDRCPYCGKWSLVNRASSEALRAAELAELEPAMKTQQIEVSEEERLRKEIESSRYQDL
jgi:hypothetical protein